MKDQPRELNLEPEHLKQLNWWDTAFEIKAAILDQFALFLRGHCVRRGLLLLCAASVLHFSGWDGLAGDCGEGGLYE